VQSTSSDMIVEALHIQREALSIEYDNSGKVKAPLSTPVFISHGQADEKVKVSLREDIVRTLQSLGMCVTWKVYQDQSHWYKVPDEIDDIVEFIVARTSFASSP
jgi:predicted esterase